ncbi:hypothetical protein [Bradyrhizobium sp. AZCC 2230]|uniref:hypothetical protein n=1 Tax=Bradyrhizobium sp. AZCC 2230 TaxID=3117021 RepID=UPI002FF24AEA
MISSLHKVSWAHDADGIAAMSFEMGTRQRWPEAVMIRHATIEQRSALPPREDAAALPPRVPVFRCAI